MEITFKIGPELQRYILQVTDLLFRVEILDLFFGFTLNLYIAKVPFSSSRFIALQNQSDN